MPPPKSNFLSETGRYFLLIATTILYSGCDNSDSNKAYNDAINGATSHGFHVGIIVGVAIGLVAGMIAYRWYFNKTIDDIREQRKRATDAEIINKHKIAEQAANAQEVQAKQRLEKHETYLNEIKKGIVNLGTPDNTALALGATVLSLRKMEGVLQKLGILNGKEGINGEPSTRDKVWKSNLPEGIKRDVQDLWSVRSELLHWRPEKQGAALLHDLLRLKKRCDYINEILEAQQGNIAGVRQAKR